MTKIKTIVAMGAVMVLSLFVAKDSAFAAQQFDPVYYANTYPMIIPIIGTDANVLYEHYQLYGKAAGWLPYEGAKPGEEVSGILSNTSANLISLPSPQTTSSTSSFVPINKLANYKGLKKKQTDVEFTAAYNAALQVVSPLVGLSREEQLNGIMTQLRSIAENEIVYSTSVPHYNDPYGYFILHTASCAGCARATGLCLNILGIPYEHVNENQWSHQWCRVPMPDGSFWICDAYGYYCGPEPAPYQHPWH